ncbi:unnamed protein product [Parajaminaea phylloscopi]
MRPPASTSWETLLSLQCLLRLVFITGLRAGSLMATDPQDDQRHGMRCRDLKFHLIPGGGAWILEPSIEHFKGSNTPATRRIECLDIRPVSVESNLEFEPTWGLLALLIGRRRLREQGGEEIKSFDDLLNSKAVELEGFTDEPLFTRGALEMSVADGCDILRTYTVKLGLPFGSFHMMRRDVAQDAKALLHDDHQVRMLLAHQSNRDVTNQRYTGGNRNVDLTAMREASWQQFTGAGARAQGQDPARSMKDRVLDMKTARTKTRGFAIRAVAREGEERDLQDQAPHDDPSTLEGSCNATAHRCPQGQSGPRRRNRAIPRGGSRAGGLACSEVSI